MRLCAKRRRSKETFLTVMALAPQALSLKPFLCTLAKRLPLRDGRTMHQVAVADEVYDEWLQEVKTLKPRKPKNWQSWLRNQRGVKSRIRFNVETDEFENYSPAHEDRQCEKLSATWGQVTPMSQWTTPSM